MKWPIGHMFKYIYSLTLFNDDDDRHQVIITVNHMIPGVIEYLCKQQVMPNARNQMPIYLLFFRVCVCGDIHAHINLSSGLV